MRRHATVRAVLVAGLTAASIAAPWAAFGVERPAPAFRLKDVNGRRFDLADHLSKDVVLLTFFATWCAPCQAELPTLEKLHRAYRDQGLRVVLVSIDDPKSAAKVKPIVREQKLSFPVLLDTQTQVVSLYNPKKAVPFSAVIDRRGYVVAEHFGFRPGDEGALEEELKGLLASGSAAGAGTATGSEAATAPASAPAAATESESAPAPDSAAAPTPR